MPELALASTRADAHAADLVRQHHAVLAAALAVHAEALSTAASGPDSAAGEAARRDLVDWCEHELVPHARAEAEPEASDPNDTNDANEAGAGCGGHTCTCGEVDGPGLPALDVRSLPHAIRHATVFGALESLKPGAGIELVASHDPLPLLAQVNQRWPGTYSLTYSERGPQTWRLSLVHAE